MTVTKTKGVQKRQPKGDIAESPASLCPPPNPPFQLHRSQTSDGWAGCSRPLLDNAIVQILKSFQSRTETNQPIMPSKYCFHLKWQNDPPHIGKIAFSQLHFNNLQKTKKWQEIRYGHSMTNIRPHFMPRWTLVVNGIKNPFIQTNDRGLTYLSCPSQEQAYQHPFKNDRRPHSRRRCGHRQDQTQQFSNPKSEHIQLDPEPQWPCIWQYRTMVQHGLPKIHPNTSARIFARNLIENDGNPIIQARPKPNINEPVGINFWRLVCTADVMIGGGSIIVDGRGRGWTLITLVQTQTRFTLLYHAGAPRGVKPLLILYIVGAAGASRILCIQV